MFKDKLKNSDGIWQVTPQAVWENKDKIRIIDVRRPDEFSGELGHIEGAELVTLETEFNDAALTWNKDQPTVFVCRSGARSGKATQLTEAMGFSDVYNMEGGMILWNSLSLPTES